MVQRNLEFTLKEYETSEKDAIPGQQIVFDFWLNNSVPTLDAQFDDIITIDTSMLPQYWSADLRFTNNQTISMAILYLLKQVEVTNFRYMSKHLLYMRPQKMKPFYLRSAPLVKLPFFVG